jgi:insulin-like growth factor 2 mRNA-binding protein 1
MELPSSQMDQLEKAITVYGQPENYSAACRRILEVMAEEAKSVSKDQEISFKILAHNNLIGRIIGKQGATIKKIMEVG